MMKLTNPRWRNEVTEPTDKWALNSYLSWHEKRKGWVDIPTVKPIQDLEDIKKRLWPPWQLRIVSDTNVQHNFMINHRFLEKQKDLCFCRECQAPIPRSLSPQNQRGRSELRLIKTYRPIQGDQMEGR